MKHELRDACPEDFDTWTPAQIEAARAVPIRYDPPPPVDPPHRHGLTGPKSCNGCKMARWRAGRRGYAA